MGKKGAVLGPGVFVPHRGRCFKRTVMIEYMQFIQTNPDHVPVIVVWTSDDWVKIITAVFAGFTTIIASIGATSSALNYRRGKHAETVNQQQSEKLDTIISDKQNGTKKPDLLTLLDIVKKARQ